MRHSAGWETASAGCGGRLFYAGGRDLLHGFAPPENEEAYLDRMPLGKSDQAMETGLCGAQARRR